MIWFWNMQLGFSLWRSTWGHLKVVLALNAKTVSIIRGHMVAINWKFEITRISFLRWKFLCWCHLAFWTFDLYIQECIIVLFRRLKLTRVRIKLMTSGYRSFDFGLWGKECVWCVCDGAGSTYGGKYQRWKRSMFNVHSVLIFKAFKIFM